PVDLPFGQERLVLLPRRCPVRELREPLQPPCEPNSLLDGTVEPFLAERHVEAGFAQRLGQRAERVPVERLRRHRAAAGVEVLRGWDAAEVLPQVAQQPDELLTRREAARDEPGL